MDDSQHIGHKNMAHAADRNGGHEITNGQILTAPSATSTETRAALLQQQQQQQGHENRTDASGLNGSMIKNIRSHSLADESRYCWVCFATDEDDELAAWVQPCKCSGTTKWVSHHHINNTIYFLDFCCDFHENIINLFAGASKLPAALGGRKAKGQLI